MQPYVSFEKPLPHAFERGGVRPSLDTFAECKELMNEMKAVIQG